jgi:hypothetical protein
MRVSSPIGELPFEPRHVAISHRGVEVSGVMGAWPARVQIGVSDVPALLRIMAKPIGVAAAATTLVLGLRRLARHRH